jgi:dihydrodiol dehydrogenase / D-xylose 1-dehydrogenase (NADP)
MFDLGPYIVLCAILALYHNPANERSKPENVRGVMSKARTGVDLSTTILMDFPKLEANAVLTTSFAYGSPKDERCIITGTKG